MIPHYEVIREYPYGREVMKYFTIEQNAIDYLSHVQSNCSWYKFYMVKVNGEA